jgi:hypothetical protein
MILDYPHRVVEDDEDKGSPSRDGVNLHLTPHLSLWERDIHTTR